MFRKISSSGKVDTAVCFGKLWYKCINVTQLLSCCCFRNSKCCCSNICMLLNLHYVIVYVLYHAAILLLRKSIKTTFWCDALNVYYNSSETCLKHVSCSLAVFALRVCRFLMYFLFLHYSQNQAKLFIEQKKIPFPVDNHNTNEELGKLASCSNK